MPSIINSVSNLFRTNPSPAQNMGNAPAPTASIPPVMQGFGQTLPSQNPLNTAGQPANPTQIGQQFDANGQLIQPAVPTTLAVPSQPADPLATLWQNDPMKQASNAPLQFNLDPAQLAELAGKLDYTQVVTPELRAKIEAGGPEATTAMLAAMNSMSQVAYQQNAQATTKLIQAAVDASNTKMLQAVDKRLGQNTLNGFIQEFNPALQDPKFAPLVNATRDQILLQFPNATPAQLTEMVSNYFNDLGIAANPQLAAMHKQQQTQQPGMVNQHTAQPDQGIDWLQYAQTNAALQAGR